MQLLRKIFASVPVLMMTSAAFATNVLPLAEIRTQTSNAYAPQFKVLDVTGLPDLPKVAMQTTSLSEAKLMQVKLDASGTGAFTITEPEYGPFGELRPRADFLMAELPTGTAAGTALSITMQMDNGESILCSATSNGVDAAICLADIRPSALQVAHYTVRTQSPGAGAGSVRAVSWAGLLLSPDRSKGIVVTGPGHVAAGATFPIRLFAPSDVQIVSLPPSSSGPRAFGAVLFDGDGNGGVGNAGILPLAWTSDYAYADVNQPLNPLTTDALWNTGVPRLGQLAPGQSATRLYFDLPPNDGTPYAPITVSLVNDYYTSVDWYVERAEFPQGSPSALVESAPSPPQVLHGSGTFTIQQPKAGRWYIVAKNISGAPVSDNTIIFLNNVAGSFAKLKFTNVAAPSLGPGLYYNPARSGHGVSISQAGGQQMLFWYTYLEDGTPTWYQAQAPAPAADSGWWTAPLYRVAWDGKAHLTQVGNALLTPIAENRFMFTWYLEDKSGSEVFVQLARSGDCPNFNGVATNFSGAWYAPALSGYGMDVLALPEQQFNLFYLYDDLGFARWGVGNSLPFLTGTTMDFRQNSGFCPSCAVTPISYQSMGSVNIDYASYSSGTLVSTLQLQPPLSGNWITNQPMRRLTGTAACVH